MTNGVKLASVRTEREPDGRGRWLAAAALLVWACALVLSCGARTRLFVLVAPPDAAASGTADANDDVAVPDADAGSDADAVTDAPPQPDDVPNLDFDTGPLARSAVLFGGTTFEAGVLDDTWLWTGSSWSLADDGGLSADASTLGLIGDPTSGDVMAALGSSLVLVAGSDTWTGIGGDDWTLQRGNVSPPYRVLSVMAPFANELVLFGGWGSFGYLGDTWTYDGTSWTASSIVGPSGRQNAAMASLDRKAVLFGGEYQGVLLGDTWTWDGAAWTELHVASPPPRAEAAMAQFGSTLILWGGAGLPGPLADMWAWDGVAWTEIAQTNAPPARRLATMAAVQAATPTLVLFGGNDVTGAPLGDTWVWDGATWTQYLGPAPPPRSGAAMSPL